MNPIGLCATDGKSLVAVIKAAQKAGIKKIIVTQDTFDDWWWRFEEGGRKNSRINLWIKDMGNCYFTPKGQLANICIHIWPADMNPKGF